MATKFRRIATEEAFSIPEVAAALREVARGPSQSLDKLLVAGIYDSENRRGYDAHDFLGGLLDVEGSDSPVVLHGVHSLLHPPEHLDRWPGATRQSLLVFIVQGLPPALIERSLRRFIALGAGIRTAGAAMAP